MARYTTTVSSSLSADEAFDYLRDFATIAQWDPGVAEATLVDGEAGQVGARYQVDTVLLGWVTPLEYAIVVEVESPDGSRRIDLRAENEDFISYDVITVRPAAGGCQVTYDADLALKGVRRLFDPTLWLLFQVIGRRAEGGLRDALNPSVGTTTASSDA